MGDAPRVFSEKLKDAENADMMVDTSQQGRLLICERFEKIQNAQRSLHPLAIQLMNEKKSGFGLVSGNTEGYKPFNNNPENGENNQVS